MELPKTSGIYTITNLINGKMYVGYTNNFFHRHEQHTSCSKHSTHNNPYFAKAIKKYGWENFKFEILEECEERFLALSELLNQLFILNFIYLFNLLIIFLLLRFL